MRRSLLTVFHFFQVVSELWAVIGGDINRHLSVFIIF